MDREIQGFDGYQLISSGGGRKLERFGDAIIDRPAPQAIWPAHDKTPWKEASAVFQRSEGGTGDWQISPGRLPENWRAAWNDLTFEIRPTGFGNVGLFPEHVCHWSWMADKLEGRDSLEVLNLFAYTGGATMACARAGARVTHVDAAKSVNGWAITNADLSSIPKDSIRYIADDALKFVKREARRGRRYDGIIMDPPTFGRGAKGEVWKIERDLHKLLEICRSLLSSNPLFLVVTSHSPGVTPRVLGSMLSSFGSRVEYGEMSLLGGGPPLPAGSFARWTP
jgi:23S rRNA (cytosine1962-C5)-methyltransferase